jgi:cyclopropane fatty-acyl-phospholipid synthase-like methyltransferase
MKVKTIVKPLLRKVINPKTYLELMRIKKKKEKKKDHIYIDPYLKAYSNIFPGESLHFPYFSNPDIIPEDISLLDLKNGGIAYVNLVIEKIVNKEAPVLDVGCGLGELCKLLISKGYKPVGLTPDQFQYTYIREKHPEVGIIKSKFENMDYKQYNHYFGTVITAESLQYLKLDEVFPIMDSILMPGGHWIVCDYFKKKATIKQQHYWDEFVNRIDDMKWEILSQQEITQNVLPFLSFSHMFLKRLLLPLIDLYIDNLQKKRPRLYYLVEDSVHLIKSNILKRLRYIDPKIFSQERKYMLLVINKVER